MQCFEKDALDFVPASDIHPIVTGEKGLGWGVGLHGDMDTGPIKKEGDLKSVAGIFTFGKAFGIQTTQMRWPFIQITPKYFAVDDAHSKYYNTIQTSDEVFKDWQSAEEMHFYKIRYQLGIEIGHNQPVQEAIYGSCIFMHVWLCPTYPTKGCTAMDKTAMQQILFWLDPEKQPIIVQLPLSEYEDKKTQWNLPDL
ncbi:MAG: hypothetical protein K940chlam8_00847 [Chlamydiae bacterium]|nr:hypothetical protein [Chlamydiota bacterium]